MSIFHRRLTQLSALALLYLLAQALSLHFASSHALAISYGYMSVSVLLALAACCRRAYRVRDNGGAGGWLLCAVALLLWWSAMMLSVWHDLSDTFAPNFIYYASHFMYFLYGAPMLLAISSVAHHRPSPLFHALDALQITLAAYLAYVAIFSVAPFAQQAIDPIPIGPLVQTFNVENLVLACAATLRLIAHRHDGEQGRFFWTMTLFLWLYALGVGLYNATEVAGQNQPGMLDLFTSAPFLLLAVLALLPPRHAQVQEGAHAEDGLALLIDNFCPIFFTAALLGLGVAVMRQQEHFMLALVALFVALVVHALRTAVLETNYMRMQRSLRQARDHLERLSLQDGLTKVANRRHFDQTLALEWQRAERSGQPLSLLMIDIDHFKSINDHYGHPQGDACLLDVAGALQSALPRSGDIVARYGGEEFAAILPATDLAGAQAVAIKMQQAIAALALPNAPLRGGIVTASIGLAMCAVPGGHAPAALTGVADQALYRAKQNGRNRVEAGMLGDGAVVHVA